MESIIKDNFTNEEIITFIKEALKECNNAIKEEEVPVGCVFVYIPNKTIIARAHNETNKTRNASKHCEINCINYIEEIFSHSELLQKFREKNKINKDIQTVRDLMHNSALFVSCEPCIMCGYALSIIQIKEVYYGAKNDKFGGNGSIMSLNKGPGWSYKSTGGYLQQDAIEVLRQFYSRGNEKAPDNKRQRKLIPK